ncbi:hypothetical protein AVEN_189526-1 [Araneus ventricosus]|uniref:Uncharacterized protein n=1 Tax=Araneus ventricosus TaxID=182803 RepID=A0A4Y2GME6_ARAVE|nr:hypothetical protein AVEN_189526-1 [Araneus ventricosus]
MSYSPLSPFLRKPRRLVTRITQIPLFRLSDVTLVSQSQVQCPITFHRARFKAMGINAIECIKSPQRLSSTLKHIERKKVKKQESAFFTGSSANFSVADKWIW